MASLPAPLRPIAYRDERLEIDFANRRVLIDSQPVSLTKKEFELLCELAANAGCTMSHVILLERVWGYRNGTRTRTVDVHLCRVRKKLASTGRLYIETIFGVGARFQPFDRRAEDSRPDFKVELGGRTAGGREYKTDEFTTCSQLAYK